MKPSDNSKTYGHAFPSSQRPWPSWRRGGRRGHRFEDWAYSSEKARQSAEFDVESVPRIKKEFAIFLEEGWEMRGGRLGDHHFLAILRNNDEEVVLIVDLETFPQSPPEVFLLPEGLPSWNASSTMADFVYETIKLATKVEEDKSDGGGDAGLGQGINPPVPPPSPPPTPPDEKNLILRALQKLRQFWAGPNTQ